VRPIESTRKGEAQERFDARRFVDGVWESKLLPAIQSEAVDLAELLARGQMKAGTAVAVKGTARVLKVNVGPPAGTLLLDLLPGDGKSDAVLQIGPEVRGSSLRDATTVISFSQFVNQIDFANVSSELNRRAVQTLPPAEELARAAGRNVEFTGTFTVAPGAMPEVAPVKLHWIGERK
jgi:predicted lipoprotein